VVIVVMAIGVNGVCPSDEGARTFLLQPVMHNPNEIKIKINVGMILFTSFPALFLLQQRILNTIIEHYILFDNNEFKWSFVRIVFENAVT